MKLGNVSVTVKPGGQVIVDTGNAAYDINTFYSYPGAPVASSTANQLSSATGGSEAGWSPQETETAPTTIEVAAQGASYSLLRRIQLLPNEHGCQIEFEDRLRNLRAEPTGILVHYAIVAAQPFAPDSVVPGGAENPTMFLHAAKDVLGVLAEDDLSRVKWGATINGSEADFQVGFNTGTGTVACVALDADKEYSVRWRLYLLPGHFDYFDFINLVRSEWKSNFSIDGPFEFFDLTNPVLQSEQGLKAYLKRKHLGLVALTPELDFNPGGFNYVLPRNEFKSRMQTAISQFKAVDPSIKCLGCIETDWVTIDPVILAQNIGFVSTNWTPQIYQNLLTSILSRIPQGSGDGVGLTPAETAIINKANLPWSDSVWRDENGGLDMEVYNNGGPWLTTLRVYPTGSAGIGNFQYRFLLENQIKFLLDQVGFDGFYIDDFSQSWNSPSTYFHSYTGWDGVSVDIDETNGKVASTNAFYIDMGLAGREARKEICEYALKEKKTVVGNSYPASAPEQPRPTNRFMETENVFSGREDPFAVPLGQEPRLVPYLLRSNLASPIGLGINPGARVSFFGSGLSVDGEAVNNGETLTLVSGSHRLATTSGTFQSWNVNGGVSVSGSTPTTTLAVSGYGAVSENLPAAPLPPVDPSTTDLAQRVMRAVMDMLRHGMTYYHYGITEIPETGTGSGEYGPINHMFPITPVALHKGWIEGRERIITAVHGTYVSVPPQPNLRPRVYCFDIHGRPIAAAVTISAVQTKRGPAWEVQVGINDWAEIAVIEYDR